MVDDYSFGGCLDCYSKSVAFVCTDAHDWGDLFGEQLSTAATMLPVLQNTGVTGRL
jgi:hypothetical protein